MMQNVMLGTVPLIRRFQLILMNLRDLIESHRAPLIQTS